MEIWKPLEKISLKEVILVTYAHSKDSNNGSIKSSFPCSTPAGTTVHGFVDKYKVEDKMNELLDKVNSNKVIEFEDLMKESSCKLETVVIFLALLELIKIRTINVYQDESFGNILIKRRRDSE